MNNVASVNRADEMSGFMKHMTLAGIKFLKLTITMKSLILAQEER